MQLDHLVELCLCDAATHSLKSFFEVSHCDEVSVINIKLFEQAPQLFVV